MCKKLLRGSLILILFLVCLSLALPGYTQTFIKRLIGVEDVRWATGGTGAAETFTATSADGRTLTFTKPDATHLKFRTAQDAASQAVEALVNGTYTIYLRTKEVITKGPEVDARAFGATRDKTTLDAAIAYIASKNKTLIISPDLADTTTTWTLADNLTIPSNINVKVLRGALLSPATAKTLTISGTIQAGPWQVFAGAGSIALSGKVSDVQAVWFPGADIGAKVNAAQAALSSTILTNRIIINGDDWCGASYATGIVLSVPVELVFPGSRGTAAIYSGTVAAVKVTAIGAKISGGLHVTLAGNGNPNVDGLMIYGASDTEISGGVHIEYPIRYGVSIDGANAGAYHNLFYGTIRVKDPGVGIIWCGTSGSAIPNANKFFAETVVYGNVGIPASGYGIYLTGGYDNYFGDGYINYGDATGWSVYSGTGGRHNSFGRWTFDNGMLGGGINIVTGYLKFERLYNNVAGTAESIDWVSGSLEYSGRTQHYPKYSTARFFTPQNTSSAASTTFAQPGIYGTSGTGTWPFDNLGSLFIHPRPNASSHAYIFTGANLNWGLKVDSAGAVRVMQSNQQSTVIKQNTTLVTSLTAAATHTWTDGIPAGSLVIGVTCRVLEAVAGPTSFTIGDGSTANKFATGVGVILNSTSSLSNMPAAASITAYPAATNIVLTGTGGNFTGGAGNGQIRLTVHYLTLVPEAN